MKKEFKGEMKFKSIDQRVIRFVMDGKIPLSGTHEVAFSRGEENKDRGLFPKDYEVEKYDVTGQYSITFEVTPKK